MQAFPFMSARSFYSRNKAQTESDFLCTPCPEPGLLSMFTTTPETFSRVAGSWKSAALGMVLACPFKNNPKGLPEDSPVVVRASAAGEHHHLPMPRYRVESTPPESVREPRLWVRPKQVLVMVLRPDSIEVGVRRIELTEFHYVTGEMILPHRHEGKWIGLLNAPHLEPDTASGDVEGR